MSEQPEIMLTRKQVGKLFGISLASVDRAIKRGDIPVMKTGGAVRIRTSDIVNLQQLGAKHGNV